jgi:hypothetical protein
LNKLEYYCPIIFYFSLLDEDKRYKFPYKDTLDSLRKHMLIIDIPNSELQEKMDSSPMYKFLFKEFSTYKNIQFNPEYFVNPDNHEYDNHHVVHFLDKTREECNRLESDFGMIFISIEDFEHKAGFLYSDALIPITKKTKDWGFLNYVKHPFNSMIIVDQYILKDDSTFDENIISILDIILPKNIVKEFHMTFLTRKTYERRVEIDLEEKLNYLRGEVKKLRKNVEFKIAFIDTHRKFHDRIIITNYMLFESGQSFIYFRTFPNGNRATSTTTLRCTPISFPKSEFSPYYKSEGIGANVKLFSDYYFQKLSEITDVINKLSDTSITGDFVNRLLNNDEK